ncbi:hypothetical protein QUB12_00800 [Microcoleus sp. B7-D4]
MSTIKPSRSWQQRFSQEFLMTVKAPRGSLQASLFATEGGGTED